MGLLETTKKLLTLYLEESQENFLIESKDFIKDFDFNEMSKYNNNFDDLFSDFAHGETDKKSNIEILNIYSINHKEIEETIINDNIFSFDKNNLYDSIIHATLIYTSDVIIDKLQTEKIEILQALTIKYFIENIENIYNNFFGDSVLIITKLNYILEKINKMAINKASTLLEIIDKELN